MVDRILQMSRKTYFGNCLQIIGFRGNRRSLSWYWCISHSGKMLTKTPASSFCRRIDQTFGKFSLERTVMLKKCEAPFFRSSCFKSVGNSSINEDDINDDVNNDDDTKSKSFKKSSARKLHSDTKYSTHEQKAGGSLLRPSRYDFTELNKNDEESRWVKRPDTIASKRRVDWYAKQMVRLTSDNQVEKAQELFDSMQMRNIRPTTEIFNILIAGYGKTGKARKAFNQYNNIKKMALQPTAHSYTSLFNICAQMQSLELSLSHLNKLWEEFREAVKNNSTACNVITYNAALNAAASCRNLALAIEIYDGICSSTLHPDCYTYSSLLVACAGEGDAAKVSWVLKEMKEHNVKPDLFVFNALLRVVRDSRTQNQSQKANPKTFPMEKEKLTKYQSKNMNTERTTDKLESNLITENNGSLDHFNSLNKHFDLSSSTGNISATPEIFTGVEDFLQLMAVNDVLPDIRTFHLLVQVAKLEVKEEKYILEVMKKWDIKPDLPVLNALVRRRALFGDISKAKKYMKMFEEELGVNPNKTTYQSLARGCRKTYDGLWLLKEMMNHEFVPDISVYGKMIKNATHRQDFQFLTELLKEMRKSKMQPTVEILELVDKAANKPCDKQVFSMRKSNKSSSREQRKSHFIRKQQLGFNGFYKTWKQQQAEQHTTTQQSGSKIEEKQAKETITYDHL